MTSERPKSRNEVAIDPELRICDAHHHLFEHPGNLYLLDAFVEDASGGHQIEETVFVECATSFRKTGPEELRPVGETEFVEAIAEQSERSSKGPSRVGAAIVGFADLFLGNSVAPVLDAHMAASPSRFHGIRHSAAHDPSDAIRRSHANPPPGMLGRDDFRAGFSELAPRGLSFDAWLFHPQIRELTGLARAFPETTIVLNHFGGPLGIGPYQGKRAAIFERWKEDIAALAAQPNVVAKLGGLAMTINGFGWHERDVEPSSEEVAEAHAPYFLHAIEQFGVGRCMFGSNYPADKPSCSYSILWNSFKRMASDFTDAERQALFRSNALRIYRISP